jgi:hypothetical protein
MSQFVTKGDFARVVMEGRVGDTFDNGNFMVEKNLIERDAAHVISIVILETPLILGQIIPGKDISRLTRPGTVVEAVASETLWFRDVTANWTSSSGSVVQEDHFYRAHMFRIVYLP